MSKELTAAVISVPSGVVALIVVSTSAKSCPKSNSLCNTTVIHRFQTMRTSVVVGSVAVIGSVAVVVLVVHLFLGGVTATLLLVAAALLLVVAAAQLVAFHELVVVAYLSVDP